MQNNSTIFALDWLPKNMVSHFSGSGLGLEVAFSLTKKGPWMPYLVLT